MLLSGNNPAMAPTSGGLLQLQCSCQMPAPAPSQSAVAAASGSTSDFQSIVNYIGTSDLAKFLGLSGLGDDTTAAPLIDWSFASGSALTAFALGLGVIIAAKTLFGKPKRKWAEGAWRSADYEERRSDYGVRPQRRRRKS